MGVTQLLVVMSVVVALALASGPCCAPAQFESLQFGIEQRVSDGVATVNRDVKAWSYDFTNKRTATFINETSSSGASTRRFVLQDFKSKMQYTLDLNTRTCTMKAIPALAAIYSCIPDEATVSTIAYGQDQLSARKYSFTMSGFNAVMSVNDQCYPIVMTLSSEGFLQTTEYVNVSPGIKNPSVFNVPTECNQEEGFFGSLFSR